MAVKEGVKTVHQTFTRTTGLKHYVGAHVSTADGVYNAIGNSARSGGNAFALFLKSQRRWTSKPYTQQDIDKFHEMCKSESYDPKKHILPHASYLINLGNPDEEKRQKAMTGFLDDLQRCEQLGIGLYNLHPGSALTSDKESTIKRIAECINEGHKKTSFVTVVLENMAGQGKIIGSTLEDLKGIIDLIEDKSRIGVCIDTCHTFAAGYDIRTKETFDKFWSQYDETVGYKYLCGIHLNDSKAPLGSNRDLHQSIGWGFLGLEAFRLVMNKKELEDLPLILETPAEAKTEEGVSQIRAEEIKLLEWLIGKSGDDEEFLAKQKELQDLGAKEREEHQKKYEVKKAKSNKAQKTLNFKKKPRADDEEEE
uniref:Apurinic-apyrimidinic endonuclease 1 n=1 Tax=Blastobotrys adeninivorans TaxID=409370 RepID=A0A060T4Q3_BLAAD